MQNLNALENTTFSAQSDVNFATPVAALAALGGGAVAGLTWLATSGHLFGMTVGVAVAACMGAQALLLATALHAAEAK